MGPAHLILTYDNAGELPNRTAEGISVRLRVAAFRRVFSAVLGERTFAPRLSELARNDGSTYSLGL